MGYPHSGWIGTAYVGGVCCIPTILAAVLGCVVAMEEVVAYPHIQQQNKSGTTGLAVDLDLSFCFVFILLLCVVTLSVYFSLSNWVPDCAPLAIL